VSRKRFRVAVVQTRPRFGAVEENVAEALTLGSHALAAAGGADLVVFPELFHTGYAFVSRREAQALAEDAVRGPTARALTAFCREHGTVAIGGLCERRGRELFNSAVWAGADGVRGVYRKVHLFDREQRWFARGREPWPVFRVGAARVGLMICFDWRFPEVARSLALAGADVVAHPANLVMSHCQEAMRTRALENGLFFATANRVGADRRPRLTLRFTGASQVVDPSGRVLARAGARGAEAMVVDLDLARSRDKRVTARNHLLRDRVPALYGALCAAPRRPGAPARR
jgi:predicted amidohydrolase